MWSGEKSQHLGSAGKKGNTGESNLVRGTRELDLGDRKKHLPLILLDHSVLLPHNLGPLLILDILLL